MDDSGKTIPQLEEEIEQLKMARDLLDEDNLERGMINDRISQLQWRISQLKIEEWLKGI